MREIPAITADAMQEMMPIMTRYTATIEQRIQKETGTMRAESKKQSTHKSPPVEN